MAELTVVIPTLDEECAIGACLAAAGCDPEVEKVVCDGGSTDATREVAEEAGARVVAAPRGRGPQLNRGAGAATAPRLLFVHADCLLPERWFEAVQSAVDRPEVALVCFRLHTTPAAGAGAPTASRLWSRALDVRSHLPLLPYGDQGFAVRREVFDAIGGFPEIPLMEDLAFAAACRRRGGIRRLPLEMRTTARRFERSPVRSRLMTLSFPMLYRLGVSPHRLARWYGTVR